MKIGLLSAPSNLGLRPPAPTSVPGCAKAPEALREAGLHRRLAELGAEERGVVLSGRYADDATPGSLRNQVAIVEHARRVAERIDLLRTDGLAPLVLGGDCSILVAAGLSLRRALGRYGLVHLDGHTDFRNPGNSDQCASLAGEDLAAAVGRHWPAIADIDGLSPYFSPVDTALDGYWVHLDVDILDPSVMPAVDSPDPGGLSAAELTELLAALAPRAVGAQVTVFDPDLDPDGSHARLLTDILVTGLAPLSRARR